jgi:Transposase DDE domain
MHKNRTRHQDGFKAHLAVEPHTGLFTAVVLTRGSGQGNHEATVAEDLLAEEACALTVLGDAPTAPASCAEPWNLLATPW